MPKYQVQAPDGHTYEYDVPDGVSQDEVLAHAQQQYAPDQPTGAIPGEQVDEAGNHYTLRPDGSHRPIVDIGGVDDQAKSSDQTGVLSQIGQGLGAGARDIAGGAGQLLNVATSPIRAGLSALGLPGGDADYEHVADHIADHLGLAKTGHVQQAIQRGIVSGLLTGGFAAPAAAGLKAGGVAQGVVGALADAPIAQAVSSGSGAGSAEVARENGAGTTGQLLAALAGGGAPLALNAATRAGLNVGRDIADQFTTAGAQRKAGSLLGNATSTSPQQVIDSINAAETPVSGAQPTLAEVAQDSGIAGFQRGHANTNLQTAATIGERNAENSLARTHYASDALGDGSPQSIQDYAQRQVSEGEGLTAAQQADRRASVSDRLSAVKDAAQGAHDTAQGRLSGAIERLGPIADRDATGDGVRASFDANYKAARDRTSQAYADPALTEPQPLNIPRAVFSNIVQKAHNFYGDAGGDIPAPLQRILSDLAEDGANTRVLSNVDSRLADFAGEARVSGRAKEAGFAESVRNEVDSFAQQAASPEYRAAIKNAKSVRAEQGRVFETGDAANSFARDRFQNHVIGNNTLPTKLVRPGAAGGDTAEGLIAAVGPEQAENTARQEIRRLADEGAIDTAAKARNLAVRYGELARRFPALQRDLADLQTHAAAFDDARSGLTAAGRDAATAEEKAAIKENAAFHDAVLNSPLGRVSGPDVDPSSYVGQLLRRSDGGRQLRVLASQISKSPDAVSGFRRALGDYIVDAGKGPNFTASGARIPSIAKTREAIDNVVKRAGPTLTKQQNIALKGIERELESANFAATASKPAGSETAINTTFSKLMNVIPGAGKVSNILGKAVAILGNKDEVDKLITRSIVDPEFAATLLKRATPRHWLQIQHGLIGRKIATSNALLGRPLTGANDASYLSRQPALAASPEQNGDNGRNGNGQQ